MAWKTWSGSKRRLTSSGARCSSRRPKRPGRCVRPQQVVAAAREGIGTEGAGGLVGQRVMVRRNGDRPDPRPAGPVVAATAHRGTSCVRAARTMTPGRADAAPFRMLRPSSWSGPLVATRSARTVRRRASTRRATRWWSVGGTGPLSVILARGRGVGIPPAVGRPDRHGPRRGSHGGGVAPGCRVLWGIPDL